MEEDKKLDLFSNDSFFDWLIREMEKHYYAIYDRKNVNENTKKIPLLFKIVNDYAKNNNLNPIEIINYNIYYVNYNDHIFSVFEHISDTNYEYGCYANSLGKNAIPYFINFDDIKNSDTNYLTKVLVNEFEEKVIKLYENGLSKDKVMEIVNGIYNDLDNAFKKSL